MCVSGTLHGLIHCWFYLSQLINFLCSLNSHSAVTGYWGFQDFSISSNHVLKYKLFCYTCFTATSLAIVKTMEWSRMACLGVMCVVLALSVVPRVIEAKFRGSHSSARGVNGGTDCASEFAF